LNALQVARQIRHRLQSLNWTTHIGVEGDEVLKVFGSRCVTIFAGAPTEDDTLGAYPWCLIGMDASTPDPEDLGLSQQRYQIIVVAEVKGDPLGEFAIIGGSSAQGSRANHGVGEVAAEVRKALETMTESDGLTLSVVSSTNGAPRQQGRGRHIALVEMVVTAMCTTAPSFAAPQRAKFNGGGTTLTWAGAHCSSRYDFIDFRVMEKTGTSPSTSVTDGTAVYTGTAATASLAFVAGRTYTVFARYGDRTTEVLAASSPEVGSWRTL
jgi:hypothetical protein